MKSKGMIRAVKSERKFHRTNIFLGIMCLLVILLFNSACSTTTTRSRGNVSKSLSANDFISLIRTPLDLTVTQELEVQSVIEADLQKRKKIMAELGTSRGNREALKAKFQDLKDSTIASVEPFLSDEQLEKFKILYEQKLPQTPPRGSQTGRTRQGGGSRF